MKLFSLLFISIVLIYSISGAAIINVPGDYNEIQTAIDNANPGDEIIVGVGIYNEYLHIDKKLSICGVWPNFTEVVGNDSGCVVTIDADSVVFCGMAVTGSGDRHDENEGWDGGILIKDADGVIVEYCYAHDNNSAGILIAHSQNCYINDNTVINNLLGIVLIIPEPSMFPEFSDAPNVFNLITDNRIIDNTYSGIDFDHGMNRHSGNIIQLNMIEGNGTGFGMIMHEANTFQYNLIMNSGLYGSSGWLCMGGGGGNIYHDNIFVGNGGDDSQAFDEWDMFTPNYWNNNYWSDYAGSDINGDGYGDDPYNLDFWTSYPADNAPLMTYIDSDNDSIPDNVDNCPDHYNTYQMDSDYDMIGNSCDNCVTYFNPDQADIDQNGIGDVCENLCGDTDGNNAINILDITTLIAYLYVGGPPPENMQQADINNDCTVNLLDITYLIAHLYQGGPYPVCPEIWPCR